MLLLIFWPLTKPPGWSILIYSLRAWFDWRTLTEINDRAKKERVAENEPLTTAVCVQVTIHWNNYSTAKRNPVREKIQDATS